MSGPEDAEVKGGGRMPLLSVRGPDGPPVTYRSEADVITVGRAPSNDVVLRHADVSRRHVEIRRHEGGWIVADMGSSNGAWLNGRPLVGQEPLRRGDEIVVGPTAIVFDVEIEGSERRDAAAEVSEPNDDGLVGDSAAMRVIRDGLDRVATSLATVLVTGESGTGKELVAQALHARSPRRDGPLVVVNCPMLRGSLLEAELFGVERGVATGVVARTGRLEKANGGTLFLDEVGDLDAVAQSMLLRFLHDRTIERLGGRETIRLDVRIVSATSRDLDEDVRLGAFRQDLLHRLDVVHLRMPPLRERREDVAALVAHFLAREGGPGTRLAPDARRALLEHDYPGNVRQLEHAIESAVLLSGGGIIRVEHLPASFRRVTPRLGPPESDAQRAAMLLDRVVAGESFWTIVREPYLRREISRGVACELIRQARARCGPHATLRDVARLLGVERQHKKLLNFLWSQRLRERDAELAAAGTERR